MILDHIPIGIIKTDLSFKILHVNQYLGSILGKTEIPNLKVFCELFVHQDDIQNDYTFGEKTRIRKNNEYILFQTEKKLLDDEYLFTFIDISKQEELIIQLREERTRLQEAYKHKSSFLANISHEVRTPINGIIGMMTLLEDTQLNEEQTSYIEMIKECSFNLMSIINDILDYTKLEAGKMIMDIKCMNLRESIESTNDIILSKMYEKNLDYNYTIDPDVPETILGDSNRIKQILLNILSNAVKFTEKGNVNLSVQRIKRSEFPCEIHEANDVFLKFSITDTGCGIDSKDTSKLFHSFSQINSGVSTKLHGGTGLGLAISKELVSLMNGHIFLERSEIGVGSTFSFVLQTKSCISLEKQEQNILKDIDVLIVDDNIQNRMTLTAMVTKWGMKAHVFSNSQEAIFYTKLQNIDIGLVDICMPKIDGYMFAERLNRKFPLVALTSLGDKLKNTDLFYSILMKPVKESKLKNMCISILKNSNSQPKQESTETFEIQGLDIINDNLRFLIAEDIYINQCVIINFLKKLGYNNIDVVGNGVECLTKLTENEYDILLLDIRMPGLNGDQVANEIQNYYDHKCIDNYTFKNKQKPYLIAVTAYSLKNDREKYITLGFDEYIPKPVNIDELKRCLYKATQAIIEL
jgi:signal transduction histidine kinase/DNA-binding response OmpR family regulator